MTRTPTIKPPFTQEIMGPVSPEARLLIILLWTAVDDEGRAFDDQAWFAGLLYPWDPDAIHWPAGCRPRPADQMVSRIRESPREFRENDPNALRRQGFEAAHGIRENFEESSIREKPDFSSAFVIKGGGCAADGRVMSLRRPPSAYDGDTSPTSLG